MFPSFQPVGTILQEYLKLNLARMKCLTLLIEAMILCRTVNLAELASVMVGNANIESHYTRLRRFVREVVFEYEPLARLLAAIMHLHHEPKWTLILDRTNWKFGRIHLNILYLAVSWKSVAVPLFFTFLEDKKCGNSDHFDRIDIIECFIKTFEKSRIEVILGDREFVGEEWIEYLIKEEIPYVFRLKEEGTLMANSRGVMVKTSDLLKPLPRGQIKDLGIRKVGRKKRQCHVMGLRNKEGQLVVVIYSAGIKDPIHLYKQRWYIETMFKGFKSSGFEMESTHITDYDRAATLFAVMALSFCIAYQTGVHTIEAEPSIIKVKAHGRAAKSVFRYGLDKLRNILVNKETQFLLFVEVIKKIFNQMGSIVWSNPKIVRY